MVRIPVAAMAACALLGCDSGGTVSLVLDIPNAMLDPEGFTSVEVRVHTPDGAVDTLTAPVTGGTFDLGLVDVTPEATIEAALRTEAGAAVGYGRAAAPVTLDKGARVVVPIRRPIVYLAGLINIDGDGDASTTNDVMWTNSPPTFSDLAENAVPDGSTKLADDAVLAIAAGPRLFMVAQSPESPMGNLIGAPTVNEVSTGDHAPVGPLGAVLDGAVVDGAGSDDGKQLVIATTTHLYVVNTDTGAARPVADGSFSRVAIVRADDGAITAIAIRNRSSVGACTAELVWTQANTDDTNQTMTIGTSGYTDVAAEGGRAFFVDSCKGGELGEATAGGTTSLRTALGKPGAVAVANGQAWIGLEKTSGMSLVSVPLATGDAPRTLFDEAASQVIELVGEPSVQRKLDATSVVFRHLEVGAGGDYVAATIIATYEGPRVFDAFPRVTWESEELRVIQTSTGAAVQRYRSWCDGVQYLVFASDIFPWKCATTPGLSAPTDISLEHRIHSMTFQFGRK